MERKKLPTDSELDILKIIWTHGPSTVRFVNEQLNKIKKVGYTTSLKMMQIMNEKTLVIRDESKRQHIYHSNFSEDEIKDNLLNKLINNLFEGSAANMVMQALGNQKSTSKEIQEVKKFLDQIEKNKK